MEAEKIEKLKDLCKDLQQKLNRLEYINELESLIYKKEFTLSVDGMGIYVGAEIVRNILNEKKELYEAGVMSVIVKINEEVK